MAARARGVGSLPTLVLPHPMETRSRAEVERIADERFVDLIGLVAKATS